MIHALQESGSEEYREVNGMKKWFLFLSAGFLPVLAASSQDADRALRIGRIENGVLPAVVVKGDPSGAWSIPGMMKTLGIPGAGLAVVLEGRIAWTKSYGLKEVKGNPVSENTRFQAASVSKPVVALAALRLVQEGKIGLDTDANVYLKAWKVPENEFTRREKVTLRRLLSHTGGVVSFEMDTGAAPGHVPTLLQLLKGEKPAQTGPVTVDMVPGSRFRYSNEGYSIVQQLLMDVENKPFPQIMRERVLDPLGMNDSSFEPDSASAHPDQTASGHVGGGGPIEGKGLIYADLAAGGLWTTPSDVARFLIAIHHSLSGAPRSVLTREIAEIMVTAQGGLGLGVKKIADDILVEANGHNSGFVCRLAGLARSGQGVVIMANSDAAIPLLSGITFAVAKEYGWPGPVPREVAPFPLTKERLKAFTGRYVVGGNTFITISLENGDLKISHPGGEDRLIPISETEFYQSLDGIKLTFLRNDRGRIHRISLMEGRLTLTKVEEKRP